MLIVVPISDRADQTLDLLVLLQLLVFLLVARAANL